MTKAKPPRVPTPEAALRHRSKGVVRFPTVGQFFHPIQLPAELLTKVCLTANKYEMPLFAVVGAALTALDEKIAAAGPDGLSVPYVIKKGSARHERVAVLTALRAVGDGEPVDIRAFGWTKEKTQRLRTFLLDVIRDDKAGVSLPTVRETRSKKAKGAAGSSKSTGKEVVPDRKVPSPAQRRVLGASDDDSDSDGSEDGSDGKERSCPKTRATQPELGSDDSSSDGDDSSSSDVSDVSDVSDDAGDSSMSIGTLQEYCKGLVGSDDNLSDGEQANVERVEVAIEKESEGVEPVSGGETDGLAVRRLVAGGLSAFLQQPVSADDLPMKGKGKGGSTSGGGKATPVVPADIAPVVRRGKSGSAPKGGAKAVPVVRNTRSNARVGGARGTRTSSGVIAEVSDPERFLRKRKATAAAASAEEIDLKARMAIVRARFTEHTRKSLADMRAREAAAAASAAPAAASPEVAAPSASGSGAGGSEAGVADEDAACVGLGALRVESPVVAPCKNSSRSA